MLSPEGKDSGHVHQKIDLSFRSKHHLPRLGCLNITWRTCVLGAKKLLFALGGPSPNTSPRSQRPSDQLQQAQTYGKSRVVFAPRLVFQESLFLDPAVRPRLLFSHTKKPQCIKNITLILLSFEHPLFCLQDYRVRNGCRT